MTSLEVGNGDGLIVGCSEGSCVGRTVGCFVGFRVGFLEGWKDGANVGGVLWVSGGSGNRKFSSISISISMVIVGYSIHNYKYHW